MNYVYLALAFAVGCLLAYLQGRSDGGELVRSEYATRDLAEAREHQATYAAWNERNRAKEKEISGEISAASKAYQEDLAHVTNEKDRALEQLRTGALQLRLTNTARVEACGSASGSVAGSGRGDIGIPRGEFLSEADSAFLIALAAEADTVAAQLGACQAVIKADRAR